MHRSRRQRAAATDLLPHFPGGIRSISGLLAEDLPLLPMYYNAARPAVSKRVTALNDFLGGVQASMPFGIFSRNAHEWDGS